MSVTLVVKKSGINAQFVTSALALDVAPLGVGSRIDSSPDCWVASFGEGAGGLLEQQVFSLVAQLRTKLEHVGLLLSDGHSVHVDIAGTVETGSRMFVSPDLLSELASLALPLTFTCRREEGAPESDPLSWIDG
ncbi:hypothetical protein ABT143_01040 [Streptomyces sp. NPDC002033]|uniref:hypothetical protein n=1 Tax=unclassified Streptomyces TaxID=2593676 RepID=UPI00331D465B